MSDGLSNVIFVAIGRGAGNQFAKEACEEELGTDDHAGEGNVEGGHVGDERAGASSAKHIDLVADNVKDGEEADEEDDGAPKSEDEHGLGPEAIEEPKGDKIEVTIDETVEAELCLPILACLVLDDLLANLLIAGVLGDVGDVAVHITVELDVLDDFALVCLKTAVEVV